MRVEQFTAVEATRNTACHFGHKGDIHESPRDTGLSEELRSYAGKSVTA
jgi:hypothetical protein